MESHLVTSQSDAEKLPKELEGVLPSDPFELLRISRALALQACSSRIQGLQDDNSKLQVSSDSSIRDLQSKVTSLQSQLNQANEKLNKAEEEQEKLAEEKAALVAMVKKLNRDVAKLETFKRTLMSQLQDEGDDDTQSGGSGAKSAPSAGASGDGGASGAGIALRMAQSAKAKASAADGTSTMGSTFSEDSEEGGKPQPQPLRPTRNQLRTPSMTPSIFSPAYTPSATPPHSVSGAAGSKSGRTRVDGKEFFRQARSRLSYEQFSTFLANIKELNAHKNTREETLKKAEEIFGAENKDLYTQFESLLSRHLPS